MEKKTKNTLILSVIICLLPMILGVVFYNKLPEQMPIHFTINDVPDNYAPKNFALFGIPLIMAIVQAICLILGILFMIIGNYIPKMSYEMGKTMAHPMPKSEKSFRKMSKIMGYSFIIMGMVLIIMIIWI